MSISQILPTVRRQAFPLWTSHHRRFTNAHRKAQEGPESEPEMIPNSRLQAAFPWRLSSSGSLKPSGGLFGPFKQWYLRQNAEKRVRKALRIYSFPDQFLKDTTNVYEEWVQAVNNKNMDTLREITLDPLASEFGDGFAALGKDGLTPNLTLQKKPVATLSSVQLVYGPYPVPEGFSHQHWFSSISLVVPNDEVQFIDYKHQEESMKKAMDAGLYIRFWVNFKAPVDLCLLNSQSEVVLLDTRESVDVQFISPHFAPDDEIFEFTPTESQEEAKVDGQESTTVDGKWLLRWKWRISDLDYVVESRKAEKEGVRIRRDLRI